MHRHSSTRAVAAWLCSPDETRETLRRYTPMLMAVGTVSCKELCPKRRVAIEIVESSIFDRVWFLRGWWCRDGQFLVDAPYRWCRSGDRLRRRERRLAHCGAMRPAAGGHDNEKHNADRQHIVSSRHQVTCTDAIFRFNNFPDRVRSHVFCSLRIASNLRAEFLVTGKRRSTTCTVCLEIGYISILEYLYRVRVCLAGTLAGHDHPLYQRREGAGPRAEFTKNMLIYRSNRVSTFEFVVVAALRAKQLTRGATPRVDGEHKPFITAQLEVLTGKVQKIGETTMPEQSDVRPRSESIPAQENVKHRALYGDDVSVSRLARSRNKEDTDRSVRVEYGGQSRR